MKWKIPNKLTFLTWPFVAVLLCASVFLAARRPTIPDAMESILVVTSDGKEIVVEVVKTLEARNRGLMYRTELGADHGMLFIFGEPGHHSFWMKNVLIPLDILWLDGDRRICHLEHNVPPCRGEPCPLYGALQKAQYVLEVNGGKAEEWGLELGGRLEFIPSPD